MKFGGGEGDEQIFMALNFRWPPRRPRPVRATKSGEHPQAAFPDRPFIAAECGSAAVWSEHELFAIVCAVNENR